MLTWTHTLRPAGAGALLLALLPGPAFAQDRGTITGQVTDEATGAPLANVQMSVAGTQRGGLTDQNGRYRIPGIPAGRHQVLATIIGYAQVTQDVTVGAGGTATADFVLRQTAIELDGIVVNRVTGEEERRRELGNVVGSIDVARIDKAAITKPADVLTGRVPGVEVRGVNGTSGTGQRIRIRGANSISLTNEPLVIVDGIRFDNGTDFFDTNFSEGAPDQSPNRLNDLNVDDIESIQVLKGPAASGLYGTAASNGVILITTKKGMGGQARWTAYVEAGLVQERTGYPDNLAALARNADGSFDHCWNFLAASGGCTQDSIARFNPFESDDFRPFRDGSRQKYGLNVSGGTDAVTYFLSGDVDKEKGVYTTNLVDKVNVRANVRAAVSDRLVLSAATSYLQSDFSQPSNDNSVLSPILNNLFGRAHFDRATPQRAFFRFNNSVTTEQFYATQGVQRYTGSLNAAWTPLGWLAINGTGGIDVFNLHDAQVLDPDVAPIAPTWQIGWVEEGRSNNINYTLNGAAVATRPIGGSIISTSTLGFDYNKATFSATRGKGFGLTPGTRSLAGTSSLFQVGETNTDVITVGAFAQQQFAFGNRIFVTGALRADDNSAFGSDFGLVYYPSATASWVISDEAFFPESDLLRSLRLRAALGESGQRPEFRQAVTFFSPATAATPNGDEPGITIGGSGNLDLKPERTFEWEAGLDAGLLGDRLSAEFTFFQRRTHDALIARNLPPSVGQSNPATLSGVRFENLGEVRNQGVELALNARLLETRPVAWSIRLSGSTLHNEIIDLGEDIDPILLNRGIQKHIAGFPAGGYWQPVITFDDADGNGKLDLNEYSVGDTSTYIGPSLPTRSASLSSEIRLFNLVRVSTLFDARAGHFQEDENERYRCIFSTVTADRGCDGFDDPNAPLATQAAALAAVLGDPTSGNTSLRGVIEKADFIKWRELALTLDVPRSLVSRIGGIGGLSLTVAGRNLATWTKYNGLDPEANESGSSTNFTQNEFGTQPQVRYWTARLNVTF